MANSHILSESKKGSRAIPHSMTARILTVPPYQVFSFFLPFNTRV